MNGTAIAPRRWRVPAPAPAALIDWPEDFTPRFTIFVDTEEDFDWAAPFARENWSLASLAALPAAHRRFADRGVPLTFLADYPVVSDARAIDLLRAIVADGRSTIGAQLHPWVNPPHEELLSPAASFAGNLPRALEAAKIDRLTDAITAGFGAPPLVYRAGRYGIGPDTFALLAARGYRIDTSMRAGFRYCDEGGPDFTAIDSRPWRHGTLIELPLTTVFTGALRRAGAGLYDRLGAIPRGRGMFARAGLLSRVPLTPEGVPVAEALEAIRVALGEGARVLNFAFHSPSLVTGNTPYVRDAADLARLWSWWDRVLDLLDRRGVTSATPADLLRAIG